MIHQCYFEESQRARLFPSPLYRGFGLYTTVNPDISRNCPELADPKHQPLLSEYAAMLHCWRNPELDPDPWIGFTSYRQLDKSPIVFDDRERLETVLAQCDILGWGFYQFVDAANRRPVSLAEQGERYHPGITSCLWRLLLMRHETLPEAYLTGTTGLFANFWVMTKADFAAYMSWSYPLVRWCLDHPNDPFVRSHPRSLAYLVERLFICWYSLHNKRLGKAGPVQVAPAENPLAQAVAEESGDEQFLALNAWNVTLAELCQRHRFTPQGIIHIGAHHAEERHVYRDLGVQHVLWVEADPQHMAVLQSNIAQFPGHRAVQTCLAETDGRVASFYRTNNRGESSSILRMGVHSQLLPQIQVIEETTLETSTFATLCERERLDLGLYDLLVMDIQGAELLALQGFGETLDRFSGIYLEVNLQPLYQGCALLGEIDAFLKARGFTRRETLLTQQQYGDAFYLRAGVAEEPPADLMARSHQVTAQLIAARVFALHREGEPTRAIELLAGGDIGAGQTGLDRVWIVRPAGHDLLLEFVGPRGRSVCLRRVTGQRWSGNTIVPPCTRVELTAPGLAPSEDFHLERRPS